MPVSSRPAPPSVGGAAPQNPYRPAPPSAGATPPSPTSRPAPPPVIVGGPTPPRPDYYRPAPPPVIIDTDPYYVPPVVVVDNTPMNPVAAWILGGLAAVGIVALAILRLVR